MPTSHPHTIRTLKKPQLMLGARRAKLRGVSIPGRHKNPQEYNANLQQIAQNKCTFCPLNL